MTNSEATRLERLETIVEQQRNQIEMLFTELRRLSQIIDQVEDEQDAADAAAVLADLANSRTIAWEDLKSEVGL